MVVASRVEGTPEGIPWHIVLHHGVVLPKGVGMVDMEDEGEEGVAREGGDANYALLGGGEYKGVPLVGELQAANGAGESVGDRTTTGWPGKGEAVGRAAVAQHLDTIDVDKRMGVVIDCWDFVETENGGAMGIGNGVEIISAGTAMGRTSGWPWKFRTWVKDESGVAEGDDAVGTKEVDSRVVNVDGYEQAREGSKGVYALAYARHIDVEDVDAVAVGIPHLDGVDIEWSVSRIGGDTPQTGERHGEVFVHAGGIVGEEGGQGVAIRAEGVGADDDARMSEGADGLGTERGGVGILGDAAGLAEVAVGGGVEIVVARVGADKTRLAPMEEVDIMIVGGEVDFDGIVACKGDGLLAGCAIGEEGGGMPKETVGIVGAEQPVAHRVGKIEGIGHLDMGDTARKLLRMDERREYQGQDEEYVSFRLHQYG